MKEIILKYKEDNPDIGYYLISKMFGISLSKLLDIFNFNEFYIMEYYFIVVNENNKIIYEENNDGEWIKNIIKNDKLYYKEFSDGTIIYF